MFLIFLLFQLINLNLFADDSRLIYKKAIQKVVKIETPESSGTGFVVENSLIMTNHHVIHDVDEKDIKLKFYNGRELGKVVLLYKNKEEDIAILGSSSKIDGLPISTDYEVGEEVYILGHPRDLDFSFTNGIMSKISNDELGVETLQYTAPSLPGSSGSPIINSKGMVVGIHKAGLPGGYQGFKFGTGSKNIKKALETTYSVVENYKALEEKCSSQNQEACFKLGELLDDAGLESMALKYFKLGCSDTHQKSCIGMLLLEHEQNKIGLSDLVYRISSICKDHKNKEACELKTIFEENLIVKDNVIPLIDIEIKLPYEFELVNPSYLKITGDEFLEKIARRHNPRHIGWIENKNLIKEKPGRTYIIVEDYEMSDEFKKDLQGTLLKNLAKDYVEFYKSGEQKDKIEDISISKVKNKEPYLFSVNILYKTGLRERTIHIYGDRKKKLILTLYQFEEDNEVLNLAEKLLFKSLTQKTSGGVIEFDKGRYLRRFGFTLPVIMVIFLGIHLYLKKRKHKKLLAKTNVLQS